ncbi:MAG: hypothetical protein ABI999_11885 [Acidobacteriota bacterium]
MFHRSIFKTVLLAFAVSSFALISFGQTGPVNGSVKIKKQDGTLVPAAGVTVDAYRTDIDKGKMPSAKTNKKGEFSFVGFILGQQYALVISGPGISPDLRPNIKAGMENISFEVSEGGGKTWTEEEVRAALKTPSTNTSSGQTPAKLTEEQKKQQAEYDKAVAAKNKAENSNKVVNAAFQEGDKLYKAKDYNGAIAKFDEGINADPDFEGSAPILLNYKAVALKDRGFDSYKQSVSAEADAKAALMEKAKADFGDAITAVNRGLTILKDHPAGADAAAQKTSETAKHNLLANYVEIFRLMVKTRADVSKAKEAGPGFADYVAIETDPVKKLNARLTLGDIMQEAGETQAALDAYLAVLQDSPDNVDALAGAGLNLINLAYLNNDKGKFQEGVNYLQKFVAAAPDTHKLKPDAVALIDTLKKEQNVTPQKGAATPKKKGQ